MTVLSIERRGAPAILHPSADTVVRPGDTVHAFGLPDQLAAFTEAAAIAD